MSAGATGAARPLVVCAAEVEGKGVADALLGVGKTAAAMRMTELILQRRPAWVLLIGVCGAYPWATGALAVLDLCVVGDDVLIDEGVDLGDTFRSISAMGLGEIGPFASDGPRARAIAERLGGEIPIVRGATVSSCSGSDARARAVAARCAGVQVESMEGAAVMQVCRHFGVPGVQLRCVSNRTGDRSRAGWNLDGAVARLHEAVRSLGMAATPEGGA